jgi:hypothetical protein
VALADEEILGVHFRLYRRICGCTSKGRVSHELGSAGRNTRFDELPPAVPIPQRQGSLSNDLAAVIDAWPALTLPIRRAVLALVQAAAADRP